MNSPVESLKTTDSPSSPSVFEVGDKVLIAEKDEGWIWWVSCGMDKYAGTVATVTRINHEDIHLDNGWYYKAPALRHADPEAKYEPKAGDVVLCQYKDDSKSAPAIIFSVGSMLHAIWKGGSHCNAHPDVTYFEKIGECKVKMNCYDDAVSAAKAYFSDTFTPTGTYEERQKQWVEHHGIKVGSKVKMTRKAESHETDWDNSWTSYMSEQVGEILTIDYIGGGGIMFKEIHCIYPFFVLEPAS